MCDFLFSLNNKLIYEILNPLIGNEFSYRNNIISFVPSIFKLNYMKLNKWKFLDDNIKIISLKYTTLLLIIGVSHKYNIKKKINIHKFVK